MTCGGGWGYAMIAAEADYATLTVANVKAATVPTESLMGLGGLKFRRACCRAATCYKHFERTASTKVKQGFASRLGGKPLQREQAQHKQIEDSQSS